MVRQAYFKKLRVAFDHYKDKVFGSGGHQKWKKAKAIFAKLGVSRLRESFYRWKRNDDKLNLLQDMYYSGPVRAEGWEADREFLNLVEFMRSEGFTDDECEQIADRVKSKD